MCGDWRTEEEKYKIQNAIRMTNIFVIFCFRSRSYSLFRFTEFFSFSLYPIRLGRLHSFNRNRKKCQNKKSTDNTKRWRSSALLFSFAQEYSEKMIFISSFGLVLESFSDCLFINDSSVENTFHFRFLIMRIVCYSHVCACKIITARNITVLFSNQSLSHRHRRRCRPLFLFPSSNFSSSSSFRVDTVSVNIQCQILLSENIYKIKSKIVYLIELLTEQT